MNLDLQKAVAYFKANNNPMMAAAIERGEGYAMQFCGWLMQQDGRVFARELPAGKEPCACGGACGGGGNCKINGGGGGGGQILFAQQLPQFPGAPIAQVLPACYQDCDEMDPCLKDAMAFARRDFDDVAWLKIMESEIDYVHVNVNAGGAGYQAGLPLAATQKVLFRQTSKQQAPYLPGGIKIDAIWTGPPVPDQVVVRLWSGERNLSGITDPVGAGLIQIGNDLTLQDFSCKDNCYIIKWPKLFNCKSGVIPNRRMVYFEFLAGGLGAATIVSLNPTIIKRHTELFLGLCGG